TAERLLADLGAALLVLAEPGPGTTEALGIDAESVRVRVREPRESACDDPTYAGLAVEVDRAQAYAGDGCWGDRRGSLLVEPTPGIVLWGAADAMSNDQVLRADNAAVSLRLLGQRDRLVWYVPSYTDLVADDGVSLQTLLPRWLRPALWLGLFAAVALIAWRFRRLGPLSTEPLPVVVKAIETTRSRGRLYRRAGDRAHAAGTLRRAARRRLSDHLRSGTRDLDPADLVRQVADLVGRPVPEIAALLGPDAPAPETDHDLIHLATELAELDREVRRP
uniref:DUF4350 domain-containing protein n=1 Tax=Nocardioides sp. TaxID=35761 RepID=UPI0035626C26